MKRLLLALVLSLFCLTPAHAAPLAVLEQEGVRVMLFDEPCALTDRVSNLPYRATWESEGKCFEGCFSLFGGVVVAAYFEDKSIAIMPRQYFQPVKTL